MFLIFSTATNTHCFCIRFRLFDSSVLHKLAIGWCKVCIVRLTHSENAFVYNILGLHKTFGRVIALLVKMVPQYLDLERKIELGL